LALLLAGVLAPVGCRAVHSRPGPWTPPPVPPGPVVYVANGGGDFRCTTKALSKAIQDEQLDLCIVTVPWSHGYARVIADQIDLDNMAEQGRHLAEAVLSRSGACGRVCLVGHSAGCGIILAAADCLPPDSVDRILLLAPSVHARYDLRPALRCAREGVDVYYSCKDTFCLGLAVKFGQLLGGNCCPAAGLTGFEWESTCPEDAALLARLRQYPWQPSLRCCKHNGGHYGVYQQAFLRNFILPLLIGAEAPDFVAKQTTEAATEPADAAPPPR
jgi:pimeloyl-ACP methyl ester carboxylesterase